MSATNCLLSKVPLAQRTLLLRRLMSHHDVHALLVPTSDAHHSEYLAPCDMRRQFLTGFTGSAGTALLTERDALLWTDSRYTLQAEKELKGSDWRIMQSETALGIGQWLKENFMEGHSSKPAVVCVDTKTMCHNEWQQLERQLFPSSVKLQDMPTGRNLIDDIWTDLPPRPSSSLRVLPGSFTGATWQEKVERVRDAMRNVPGCEALLLCALDEIAWLLNLRGADVPFNPVFFAYLLVTLNNGIHLFMHQHQTRVSREVSEHLQLNATQSATLRIHDYESIYNFMVQYSKTGSVCWMDPLSVSRAFTVNWPERRQHLAASPVVLFKCAKSKEEVEGMRQTHLKDGVAMCRFLHYLETRVDQDEVTEVSAGNVLDTFRSEESDFVSPSFPTIAGYASNGAIVHYRAQESTNQRVGRERLFLVDSGGQYSTGTTDVTRTLSLGRPNERERRHFTLVLKGHIALARMIFPKGTKGSSLDSHARTSLWREGLDYGHGTGHGVGAFLNVHEGPCRFAKTPPVGEAGLRPNTFISIEPGLYIPGEYGIRIENVVLVTEQPLHDWDVAMSIPDIPKGFLAFHPVTCVPIQKSLVEKSLLDPVELEWFNEYHQFCWRALRPILLERKLDHILSWLAQATSPL